ncbi:methylamine dehydrogenase light chain [Parahaliea mediterranea]|uniref:Methylamine dehydrogenase (Amicyanin) light chain n=1 Tax=Parahaliea mediterranea TaxID=651086 RepID=A0A939DGF1_9GAMM|nr:methylamine dehydrogenase light chain [Parahaliea mediterranea]MBN7797593.1 methylamine dehydrogenase (amicyanin) light chain [Parahaliea mediterranea]
MNDNNWMDRAVEHSSRDLASRISRRSLLGRLGQWMAGAAMLPLLPVARFAEGAAINEDRSPQNWNDPQKCDYWAYCGTNGYLCSCCGGTSSKCPPGTEPSPISWIGTCRNPADGKHYVISYTDCCGAAQCGRCACDRDEGATPRYLPQRTNMITWCYGGVSSTYNCTVSRLMSVAEVAK